MTKHKIIFQNSSKLNKIKDKTVHLVVTSPPYPMIEMWDDIFSKQNLEIKKTLESVNSSNAFELMHKELDDVWKEVYRVLIDGGIACINIGDATRTTNGNFQIFSNHARILNSCLSIGFQALPAIIWRKQTNAPNKFMGSGMLPPGAYITLEHEYILILRKGEKRLFKTEDEKRIRKESSYFWEERNTWFSDVWMDLKGTGQKLNFKEVRNRSGAFPFELAYRVINMFSVKGDTVLDPFLGTGTTTIAALASERNSLGVEVDRQFVEVVDDRLINSKKTINVYIQNRIKKHMDFIRDREDKKKKLKYLNEPHGFRVVTNQERGIKLRLVDKIEKMNGSEYKVHYTTDLAYESNKTIDRKQYQLPKANTKHGQLDPMVIKIS